MDRRTSRELAAIDGDVVFHTRNEACREGLTVYRQALFNTTKVNQRRGIFEAMGQRNMIDMPLDDRVLTALERSPYVTRRSLRFETREGRVTLRGVVNTYFQKQMAQEALRYVDGINEIANELEVCWG